MVGTPDTREVSRGDPQPNTEFSVERFLERTAEVVSQFERLEAEARETRQGSEAEYRAALEAKANLLVNFSRQETPGLLGSPLVAARAIGYFLSETHHGVGPVATAVRALAQGDNQLLETLLHPKLADDEDPSLNYLDLFIEQVRGGALDAVRDLRMNPGRFSLAELGEKPFTVVTISELGRDVRLGTLTVEPLKTLKNGVRVGVRQNVGGRARNFQADLVGGDNSADGVTPGEVKVWAPPVSYSRLKFLKPSGDKPEKISSSTVVGIAI